MYRLGVIEESLDDQAIVSSLAPYAISRMVQEVPGDQVPLWHSNVYRIPDGEAERLIPLLVEHILPSWYIHLFRDDADDGSMTVILQGKSFVISRTKGGSWQNMLEYADSVGVGRRYTENIPLDI